MVLVEEGRELHYTFRHIRQEIDIQYVIKFMTRLLLQRDRTHICATISAYKPNLSMFL